MIKNCILLETSQWRDNRMHPLDFEVLADWWIMPYINTSMKRAVAELIREAMDNARNSI